MAQALPDPFNLAVYLAQYQGRTRIEKALFIAKNCTALEIDAYQAALDDIQKETRNIKKYKDCLDKLNDALERHHRPSVAPNMAWLEADRSTTELENEARKNLGEAARLARNKLGDYHLSMGNLRGARESYESTHRVCTKPEHTIELCFNKIKVYLEAKEYFNEYINVPNIIVRAENLLSAMRENGRSINDSLINDLAAQLKCYRTLTLLDGTDSNRFRLIAMTLKDIPVDSRIDVLAPCDVAIYGGLCALASFNRNELRTLLTANTNFNGFLDLEPCIREMMEAFLDSKFTACLKLLDAYRDNLSLDVYLHAHIDTILTLIREKALIQYCTPYAAIDMRRMAAAFEVPVARLEDELVTLITKESGGITARIDSLKKILYTKRQERRNQAFQKSLEAGVEYEKAAKILLLRLELVKKGMVVQ